MSHFRGSLHALRQGEPCRPYVIAGAGGLLSTTLDLAKWDAALNTDHPLRQALREAMWTPAHLADSSLAKTEDPCGEHYGFGWFIGEHRGHRLISHTGETDAGFSAEIARFIDQRLTIIVLCNIKAIDQVSIAKGVAEWCDPALRAPASAVR